MLVDWIHTLIMFTQNICNLLRFWTVIKNQPDNPTGRFMSKERIHPVNGERRRFVLPAGQAGEGWRGTLGASADAVPRAHRGGPRSSFSECQGSPRLASPCVQAPGPARQRGGGRGKLVDQSSLGSGCRNQEGQAPLELENDHLAERCQGRRSCGWEHMLISQASGRPGLGT